LEERARDRDRLQAIELAGIYVAVDGKLPLLLVAHGPNTQTSRSGVFNDLARATLVAIGEQDDVEARHQRVKSEPTEPIHQWGRARRRTPIHDDPDDDRERLLIRERDLRRRAAMVTR
jgi:hypothetical protein